MSRYSTIGFGFILLIWSILSYENIVDKLLLPHPQDIIFYLYDGFFVEGFFVQSVLGTLNVMLVSFVLGGIIGIICGIVAGYYEKIYQSFEMILDFFRSLPSLLLIPLSFLLFGVGQLSSIIVISWSVFVYFFMNTAYGVKYNRSSYLDLIKLYRISKYKKFKLIILPSILPNVFVGAKTGFSIALIVTIGSEMLNGHQGLGGRIIDSYMIYNTKEVFAIIVIVGLLGYLGSKLLDLIERKLIHWKGHW